MVAIICLLRFWNVQDLEESEKVVDDCEVAILTAGQKRLSDPFVLLLDTDFIVQESLEYQLKDTEMSVLCA